MRTVTPAAFRSVLVLMLALGFGTSVLAQDETAVRTARITYVSGASIYVDAGEGHGVAVGTRLTAYGSDLVLVVTEVSRSRAVAQVESGDPAIAVVGFELGFVPEVLPVAVETLSLIHI